MRFWVKCEKAMFHSRFSFSSFLCHAFISMRDVDCDWRQVASRNSQITVPAHVIMIDKSCCHSCHWSSKISLVSAGSSWKQCWYARMCQGGPNHDRLHWVCGDSSLSRLCPLWKRSFAGPEKRALLKRWWSSSLLASKSRTFFINSNRPIAGPCAAISKPAPVHFCHFGKVQDWLWLIWSLSDYKVHSTKLG